LQALRGRAPETAGVNMVAINFPVGWILVAFVWGVPGPSPARSFDYQY
jgi:hypothetical protein